MFPTLQDMKLVKLGGSVITFKGKRKRFRSKTMEELAEELAPFERELCVVHGGGSYGHPLAQHYGVHRGLRGREDLMGFAEVQRSMRELNGRVLEGLHAQKIPAVSLPPGPMVMVRDGKVTAFNGDAFVHCIEAGLVPVTFGDAVLDSSRGSSIISGDDLMLLLARLLRPEVAIFVSDVEGVRGADGALLPLITHPIPELVWKEEEVDVTGGLRRKLSLMMEISKEGPRCFLISGLVTGRLKAAMEGRKVPCTEVRWS